jgi:hypothetical protein
MQQVGQEITVLSCAIRSHKYITTIFEGHSETCLCVCTICCYDKIFTLEDAEIEDT